MAEVVIIEKPNIGTIQGADVLAVWRGSKAAGSQYSLTVDQMISKLKDDFYTEAEIDDLYSINSVGAGNFDDYDPGYTYLGGLTYYVEFDGGIFKFISATSQTNVDPDSDVLIWQPINVGEFAHLQNTDEKLAADTANEVTAADIRAFIDSKGSTGGLVPINGSGKIDAAYMPSLSIVQFLGEPANQAAMLALTGESGDWCIRADDSKVYVITGSDPTDINDWKSLSYPGASLNGSGTANRVSYWTGIDTLSFSAVTLTELEYLSGTTSAIQPQLNAKANLTGATFTGAISSTEFKQGATTILSTGGVLQNVSGNISMFTNNVGYLTSYTETDPTVGAHIKAITATNISNWNTAHGWGNHAGLYAAASHTHAASQITAGTFGAGTYTFSQDLTVTGQLLVNSKRLTFSNGGVSNLDHIRHDDGSVVLSGDTYPGSFHFVSDSTISAVGNSALYTGFITTTQNGNSAQWKTAHDRSITSLLFDTGTGVLTLGRQDGVTITKDLDGRYLTSYTETDPTVGAHIKAITATNISNWNTAHGWGNHAAVGYLTAFSETDTLDSVIARNSNTTRAINTGLIHITGNDSRTGVFGGVPSPNQLLRIENTNTGVGTQAGIHLRANNHDVHLMADYTSTNNGNFRIVMDADGASLTALRIYTAGEVEIANDLYVRNGAGYSLFGSDATANNSLTNNQQKYTRIGVPHYTNASLPVAILTGNSNGTDNIIGIGGGSSLMNAATRIELRTSSNTTTTIGTAALTIDGNQDIVITGDLTHVTTSTPAINTSIGRYSIVAAGTLAYGQFLVRTGVTDNTAGEVWIGIRSGGGFIWSQKIDQDSNIQFSDDIQVGGQIAMIGQTFTGSHASTLIFAHNSRILLRPNGSGNTTGQLDLLGTGIGTYSGRFVIKRGSGYGGGAYNTTLDDLVLDVDGNGGISIMTPNSAYAYLGFGDPQDNYVGGMRYAHPTNQLSFNSNNAEVLIFTGLDATFSGDITLGDATTSPTTLILETNSTTASFAEIGFEHGGVRQWEIESFPDAHSSFGGLFSIRDATSSTRVFTLDGAANATFSGNITTEATGTGVHHEFKRAGTLIGDIWISSNDFALRPSGGKVLSFGTSGTDADIKMFSTIGETFVMNGTTGTTTWTANATFSGDVSVAENDQGLRLSYNYVNANTSSRLFHKEAVNQLYGMSWLYAGEANPTIDGSTFTLSANTYHLIRHNNSELGDVILSFNREDNNVSLSGDIILTGSLYGNSDTGATTIAGGGSTANGGRISMFGGSHSTEPSKIWFYNGNTPHSKFDASGNLGLGADPSATYKLHVVGNIYGDGNIKTSGSYFGSSESTLLNIQTTGAYFNKSLSINQSTVNGSYTFYVNGSAFASTNFSSGSDERIKTHVNDIDDALDVIMQLKPYRYIKYNELEIGFGAQTTQKILPEVVNHDKKGDHWSIKYDQFTAVNTRAIQLIRVDQLSDRARIVKLEQKVADQALIISKLKAA